MRGPEPSHLHLASARPSPFSAASNRTMSRSSAGAPCTRYLRTGFDKSLRQFYEWARRAVSTRAHCRRASSTPAEIYTALCQYRAADKKQKRRRSKKDRKSVVEGEHGGE